MAFPSPALDYAEERISLDELIIKNPLCTYRNTMKRKQKINRIKQIIVEHESTGKALAEWLGYHPNSISQWSLNAAQPTLTDLLRIAAYFNINVQSLIVPTEPLPGLSPCEEDKKRKPKGKIKAKTTQPHKKKKNQP